MDLTDWIALISVPVAIVSALYAISSARSARRSADEAAEANHLAKTPEIVLETDGHVSYGLQVIVRCDTDLDELRVGLVRRENMPGSSPSTHGIGRGLAVFTSVFCNAHPAEKDGTLVFRNYRAGSEFVIMMMFAGASAPRARPILRCEATLGDQIWTIIARHDEVKLRYPYPGGP